MSQKINSAAEADAKTQDNNIRKATQCQKILEYLQTHEEGITPIDALNEFGCFRLGARISDLRKQGYNISTTIALGKKNYAIYKLED